MRPTPSRSTAIRASGDPGAASGHWPAPSTTRAARIADAHDRFRSGRSDGTGAMPVPFELRNDFASIAIDGEAHGRRCPRARREFQAPPRRPAVAGGSRPGAAAAFAALLYPAARCSLSPISSSRTSPDLAEAIPELLAQKPSMIIMADIGTIPDTSHAHEADRLDQERRHADPLRRLRALPPPAMTRSCCRCRLRQGERSLGGALSWTEPQPLADFPGDRPFADMRHRPR